MEKNKIDMKRSIWSKPKVFYCCKLCDYNTSDKTKFTKHSKTQKHQKREKNNNKISRLTCEFCKSILGSKTSLWRHKKNCSINNKKGEKEKKGGEYLKKEKNNNKTFQKGEKLEAQINVDISNNYESENYFMYKFFDAQQKNIDTQQKNIEAQNKIITLLTEKVDTQQIIQTPNVNNNCNNTNNITINMYLNDYCKDAMNLEDFINKVKLTVQDVVDTANNGYVSSMSNIVIRELENIPTQKRPIHCTDENRGNFYVKDDNKWGKDEKNVKMKGLLHKVSIKNRDQFKAWQHQNPNYKKDESKFKTCNKMMMNMFGGTSEEIVKKNKIKSMKEIGKSINIKEAINEIK